MTGRPVPTGGFTTMERAETIDRHLPLQREAARALGLLATGQKFDAVELNTDGSAEVTFTDAELLKLTPAAASKAAGIALAFDFENSRLLSVEDEAAWLTALLVGLDGTDPKSVDVLATGGDLTTALAEGQAFVDMNQRAIDEAVGSAVTRGGRVTFALLNSSFGHTKQDVDARPDLVEMAGQTLKPHAAAIRAVDKKVKSLLAAQ